MLKVSPVCIQAHGKSPIEASCPTMYLTVSRRKRGASVGRKIFSTPTARRSFPKTLARSSGSLLVDSAGMRRSGALGLVSHVMPLVENPNWLEWFETILVHLGKKTTEPCLRVDHIGSTSVPGMTAKPVIDLILVIRDQDSELASGLLVKRGYFHQGDLGIQAERHSAG